MVRQKNTSEAYKSDSDRQTNINAQWKKMKKTNKQTNKQIKQNETKTKDKKTQPCEQLTVKNELNFSNLVII